MFAISVPEPQREGTINFPGGALSAARQTLANMFPQGGYVRACDSEVVQRSRRSYTRTEYVGATSKVVEPNDWEFVKYPYITKSISKGGQAIKVRIQGTDWTMRLSGNLASLADFFCAQGDKNNLNGTISFISERGSFYGPYSNKGDA